MIDVSEDELAELFGLSEMALDAATVLFTKLSRDNPKLTRIQWLEAYTDTTQNLQAIELRIMLCVAIKRMRDLEQRVGGAR